MKDADRDAWTKHVTKQQIATSLKRSKYGAVKTEAGGRRYDSAKEAKRGLELAMLQAAGEIRNLKLQVEFPIEVVCADHGHPSPVRVASYFADFTYEQRIVLRALGEITAATNPGREVEWRKVVEDVKSKGTRTALYSLKRKLVEALYGITITET